MNDPRPEGHMASYIRRRKFLAALRGGAAAWPLAARAQQPERMRRITVLMNNAEDDPEGQARAAAFRQGLHGSVRGACDETHVPTATAARIHCADRRRGSVAARGARAAGGDAGDWVCQPHFRPKLGQTFVSLSQGAERNRLR